MKKIDPRKFCLIKNPLEKRDRLMFYAGFGGRRSGGRLCGGPLRVGGAGCPLCAGGGGGVITLDLGLFGTDLSGTRIRGGGG